MLKEMQPFKPKTWNILHLEQDLDGILLSHFMLY